MPLENLATPTIGLGTFPFAGPFTLVDDEQALQIVQAYLDQGGSYLDTAPTYAFGRVESLLGDALRGRARETFFVNTSCGYVREGDGFRVSGKEQDVRADFFESLERLGLEYIDSYISHIPDLDTPFEETVGALELLKAEGLVRHIGVSNVTFDQLKLYCQYGDIELVQNRFSLINRSLDATFIDYCMERGIGIVAYQVIERGILSDVDHRISDLRSGDLRSTKPEFADEVNALLRPWVKEMLQPIASTAGMSTACLAMAWAASQPGIAVVQAGATSSEQLSVIADARRAEINSSVARDVDDAYAELVARVRTEGASTVREFMGLESYNLYGGSASGKV